MIIWGSSLICFWDIPRISAQFMETGPKYHKLLLGDTRRHPESSDHHFTSNEPLVKCDDHLSIQSNLFYGIWGITTTWVN